MKHSLSEYLLDLLFKLGLVCSVALPIIGVIALAVPCFAYPLNIDGSAYSLAPSSIYLLSHDELCVGYGTATPDVSDTMVRIEDGYEVDFSYDYSSSTTRLDLYYDGRPEYFTEFHVEYPYLSYRPDESIPPVDTLVFSTTGGGGHEEVTITREYTFYYYNQAGELISESYSEYRTYYGELVNYAVPLVPSYAPNHTVGFELVVYGTTDESFEALSFTEPYISDTPVQYGPNLPEHNVTIVTSPNVFEWLSNSIGALLDTPILGDPAGDYSYTIGNLLFLVVCIPLVVSFLKLFAGG